MSSALEVFDWMKSIAAREDNRFLFRGQNRIWPTIRPSISRDDPQTAAAMWDVCTRFHFAAAGITGYSIPNEHDRLAILQHYVGRSPVIDLTGTPEVALYFALQDAAEGQTCIVYALDRTALPVDTVVSDHAFLAFPLDQGGLQHRWLRQDGYSVGPADWRSVDRVADFDLLHLPGLRSWSFTKRNSDAALVKHLGDLEAVVNDPLARAVRGVVNAIVRSLGAQGVFVATVLNRSKTPDPDAELTTEINSLLHCANDCAAHDLVQQLKELQSAVTTTWDMSHEAALDWTRRELQRRGKQQQ